MLLAPIPHGLAGLILFALTTRTGPVTVHRVSSRSAASATCCQPTIAPSVPALVAKPVLAVEGAFIGHDRCSGGSFVPGTWGTDGRGPIIPPNIALAAKAAGGKAIVPGKPGLRKTGLCKSTGRITDNNHTLAAAATYQNSG